MRYVSDVPADLAPSYLAAEKEHVRAYLAAVADEDDDPATRAADVMVFVEAHPDDIKLVRIVGSLDAEPNAPYLQPGYDPYAGVDPALFAAEVEAAERDAEVLRGQA